MTRYGLRLILIFSALSAAAIAPAGEPPSWRSDSRARPFATSFQYHTGNHRASQTPSPGSETFWGLNLLNEPAPRRYLSPDFDIPLELNDTVREHLMKFQRHGGKGTRVDLERGGFFIEHMRQALWEEGCPRDLVYLSMIESSFSPTARSIVDAAGSWQFIESTGKNYGLEVAVWTDDRLDIEKSTRAAGQYLMDLYDQFENWPLVLAAYNAGPGTINKAIRNSQSDDFWELIKHDDLHQETKSFVPRFYAALIIGKHPERFGIEDFEPMEPHRAVEIQAPPLTDMLTVAKLSGAPYEQIVDLNAQYLFECTPPFPGPWTVRVPGKYSDGLQAKIDKLDIKERNAFVVHKVRSGESIFSIARRYHVPSSVLVQANGLRSVYSVKAGQVLVVPKRASGPPPRVIRVPDVKKVGPGKYEVKYTVGEGDSLWKIARKADIHIEQICEWNNINKEEPIYPGQTLTIYCSSVSIARRLGQEGNKNRAKNLSGPPKPRMTYHTVRAGENLSTIARKYGVTVEQIVGWNKLKNPNHLSVGQKLKILR